MHSGSLRRHRFLREDALAWFPVLDPVHMALTENMALTPGLVFGTVLEVHKAWAWVMIIGNGMAGLWSLGAHRFPALRTRSLWWFTIVVEVAVFIQVMLGVWMVNKQKIEPPQFHLFYGFVGIIAIGIIYSYRNQMMHKLYLLYGFGGLFIMGLGIRAVLVGQRTIGG